MSAERAHDLLCCFQHLLDAAPLWPVLYESSTSDGQMHYTVRQGSGDGISLFCVQAPLQGVTLRSLYELLSRVENRKLWDTSFEAGQVLEELPCEFAAARTEYIRLAGIFPVVKQRDMVVLSINAQNTSGEIISASSSVQSPLAPTKKGYQRFSLSIGGCMLREVTEGVELTQITDIGDLVKWMPAYVIRTCTQVLVPRFLAKVRKEAIALASTLDVTSANDWKPSIWSPRTQNALKAASIPKPTESSRLLDDAVAVEPDVMIEAHHDAALSDIGTGLSLREGTLVQAKEPEIADSRLAASAQFQQPQEMQEEPHCHNLQERSEVAMTRSQAEEAQDANSQEVEAPPSVRPEFHSVLLLDIPLAKSDEEQEDDNVAPQSAPASPLPLPRQRARSTYLWHSELTMRRLSYFGGVDDQYEMDEELESTLTGALDSSTGLQAAHRLSKALSQLELARRYGDEGAGEHSGSDTEKPGPKQAAATNDEEALVREIRDAAQPFFGSSIEGRLYTPSTDLAVAKSDSAQVPSSWLGSLSSVLYYLPGSTLFTRPR